MAAIPRWVFLVVVIAILLAALAYCGHVHAAVQF